MGLYYQISPNQTLSTKPIHNEKKDKTRITVLLGTNAIGTDKLKSWVIGNAKYLRPLSKINMKRLSVYYHRNSKVWMNLTVFGEVLRKLDRYFKAKSKKILLLIDNALSYFNPNYLPNEQDEDNANEEIKFVSTSSKFL